MPAVASDYLGILFCLSFSSHSGQRLAAAIFTSNHYTDHTLPFTEAGESNTLGTQTLLNCFFNLHLNGSHTICSIASDQSSMLLSMFQFLEFKRLSDFFGLDDTARGSCSCVREQRQRWRGYLGSSSDNLTITNQAAVTAPGRHCQTITSQVRAGLENQADKNGTLSS